MPFKYIDVHCHPNLGALKEDQNEVIARMKEDGVLGIVVGVDLASSREAVALAEEHEHLFATVGLHPNDTPHEHFNQSDYLPLVRHKKTVAIGECGLDFFRIQENADTEKARQWKVFKEQVAFALEHNLPLMIHCRPSKGSMDAYEEILSYFESILDVGHQVLRGNVHFFVGNLEIAERFWNLGFTTSLTGVITFAREYDEVVRKAPLAMLLSETDAPYAAPLPHRGKRNEPVYVRHIVEKIAELRGISEDETAAALLENARRVFGVS